MGGGAASVGCRPSREFGRQILKKHIMLNDKVDTAQDIDSAISQMNDKLRTAYQATFSCPGTGGYYIPAKQFLRAVGMTQAELEAFMAKYRNRQSLNYPTWAISVSMKMRDFWNPTAYTPMMVSISPPDSR